MLRLKHQWANDLVNFSQWLSERKFYQVILMSLTTIFPIAAVGAFITLIDKIIFIPTGVFNQFYQVSKWLPFYAECSNFWSSLDILINNLVVIWLAFLVAANAAKLKQQNEQLTGIVSGTFLWLGNQSLFMSATKHGMLQLTLNFSGLAMHGVFAAIMVGFFVSWLLGRCPKHQLLAMTFLILIGAATAAGFHTFIPDSFTGMLMSKLTQVTANWGTNIFLMVLIVLISNLLMIFGIIGPLNSGDGYNDAVFSIQNLNYALQYHHLGNIPYPINLHAIYDTYAFVGGSGMLLALLIAILWRARDQRVQQTAKISFLPVLFNLNSPMFVGLPVLFNPLLVIPFIVTPIVACLVAWLFVSLHLMPTAVYPVPLTTPGFLKGFLATGGNWVSLLVGILNLLIATIIYLPFVTLNDKYDLVSKVGEK
ncbi:PTS transporter subunit EIIC [Loigolactobacillus coryniformis]|uniref:Permease IIC component n=3 Tax=Loigolactobacillus coryniformis TaxID=1610 RepID=J2Z6D1_9LACO|nr:PTS transporter subunit EIIC [Loigolactobacillus coryniformis]MDT3392860.1 PTS transporter subunit EIIC [Bacillota bacterium]OEH89939.1 PTS sugar transporter [Loigolactobacillus coryniformis subsp. coryniformis]RRG05348.1 MAG: PTS sugar transporter subunit IIC [Lactobacillus sp.]ATO54236.1 PTS sugar transporter [Loigolactobacillus coryniformis subsp. coryniformis KCTC 3167 = DSM 20001]EJN56113.1 Cellobiose PTS, EIIC [Loigolactobacillus coryniformis subsp. coryniformis CECT 5711]